MNQQQFLSLVRAALLIAGTILLKKGITDSATWTIISGTVVGVAPIVWSMIRHSQEPGSLSSNPPPIQPPPDAARPTP